MKQRPTAIGMLICECMIVEEKTRNVTPVNCFTRRAFRSYPSEAMTVIVAVFLTDGLGETELEVVVQDLHNWDEIRRLRHPVSFQDPLQEYRCVFRLRDFSVPRPGHYQIALIVDGETIAQRKIVFTVSQS